MNSILTLVEGSFGALVMVGCGILAMVSVPVALGIIVIGTLMKRDRSWQFYVGWLLLPVFFLFGAIGMFILRSLLVTFFDVEIPK